MKLNLLSLVLYVLILLVYAELFTARIPMTHDGQNHLGRIANYYLAVKQGQFPPRWAPNLNNGFGYPVFNYNYPLANVLAVPLIAVGVAIEGSFLWLHVLSLTAAYWSMLILLRIYTNQKAAAVGAFFYTSAPYVVSLVFVRGVIGELLSYALLPLVLYLTWKTAQAKSGTIEQLILGLAGAGFLLAHNIMALFGSGLIVLYAWWVNRESIKNIKVYLPSVLVATLLSAFFYLPALAEKKWVVLDQSGLISQYPDHFATLTELSFHAWDYGLSRVGPVDGLYLGVGSLSLVLVFLITIWSVKKRLISSGVKLVLLALGMIFLMVWEGSSFVWNLLPFVSYIQFPWRLLFFWPLFFGLLLAWWLDKLRPRLWLLACLVLLFTLVAWPKSTSYRTFSMGDEHWLVFPETTTVAAENNPVWFDRTRVYERKDEYFTQGPVYIAGEGDVYVTHWDGSEHGYHVTLKSAATIFENTLYFPGWELKINGDKQEIAYENQTLPGLISYYLEPGNYTIESRFTQNTPARWVGNMLSIMGILIAGWMAYGGYKSRFKN